MNDPNVFENPCPICKKREATHLCDYVIKYSNAVLFMRNYHDFVRENRGTKNDTCDLPLCEECACDIGVNVDVCPHHYKLHLQAELPEELKKYQLRSKAKIIVEEWEHVTSTMDG